MKNRRVYTHPTTDNDILGVCVSSPLTRGEVAKKVERSLHAALISRIVRLKDEGWLIEGQKELINGVLAYTYQTHPAWLQQQQESSEHAS